jgi:nitroimidazol reductase NimA-like FMN-containing flavoprotein (pyridoxamine 5'-phosphate oxidase superfamily)
MTGGPHIDRLSAQECLSYLAEANLGRVAVCLDALPAIRSVRFGLALDGIVFRVAPESRLRRATFNQVIAFHADNGDREYQPQWAVNVQGKCREVSSPNQIDQVRDLDLPPWHSPTSSDVFMHLPIERISGERIQWPSEGPPPTSTLG